MREYKKTFRFKRNVCDIKFLSKVWVIVIIREEIRKYFISKVKWKAAEMFLFKKMWDIMKAFCLKNVRNMKNTLI